MKKALSKKENGKKNFDPVAMKNEIQAKLYEQTKNLNSEELIEFYRNKAKTGPFKNVGGPRASTRKANTKRD